MPNTSTSFLHGPVTKPHFIPGRLSRKIFCEMNSQNTPMKFFSSLLAILTLTAVTYSQSGRRVKTPSPAPSPEVSEPAQNAAKNSAAKNDEPPPVTAEKKQDYFCTEDGSLARIIDPDDQEEIVVSAKDSDVRATISAKPKPSYTREARRNGVQGFVTLKVLLSARGKVARIRVVKGLPAGLTENAIRAACKIEFKPAMKDGRAVSQWVTAEYVFRLAESSIFTP